jgi:hypothetical protein
LPFAENSFKPPYASLLGDLSSLNSAKIFPISRCREFAAQTLDSASENAREEAILVHIPCIFPVPNNSMVSGEPVAKSARVEIVRLESGESRN